MSWPRDTYVRAVWSSDLTAPARLIALAYADHAQDQEFAFVGPIRMAARTGLSRATIRREIRTLVDAGWLAVKEQGGPGKKGATRYWLRVPEQSHSDTVVVSPRDHERSQGETAQGERSQGETTTVSPRDHERSHCEPRLFSRTSPITSSIDARAADTVDAPPPDANAAVVAELVRRHGSEISEQDAVDCVAWAVSSGKLNVGGYLSRFPAADIKARAAEHRGKPPAMERCDHNVVGGNRILGRGHQASRRCDRCEAERPAAMLWTVGGPLAAEMAS